jgi:tmRNA-binding protein
MGIGRVKMDFDKRQTIRERDDKRDMARAFQK